jgi:YD repeat-containing protein
MKIRLSLLLALAAGLSQTAYAETSLTYQLVDAQGATTEQTYTLHGRWARVDDATGSKQKYLILDTGFMIMHVVDSKNAAFSTYGESHFHQGKQTKTAAEDANAKQAAKRATKITTLKPTGRKDTVAGIRCNLFSEIVNNKPVAEHCMAGSSALGMNNREMITMARLIDFSKEWTDPDWIANQSNEQFVSIRSRPAEGDATFLLKAVSHKIPPLDYFRVPPQYKKLDTADDYTGLITGAW